MAALQRGAASPAKLVQKPVTASPRPKKMPEAKEHFQCADAARLFPVENRRLAFELARTE